MIECPHCGSELTEDDLQPWGAVVGPSGREWCPKCGKKIGGEHGNQV